MLVKNQLSNSSECFPLLFTYLRFICPLIFPSQMLFSYQDSWNWLLTSYLLLNLTSVHIPITAIVIFLKHILSTFLSTSSSCSKSFLGSFLLVPSHSNNRAWQDFKWAQAYLPSSSSSMHPLLPSLQTIIMHSSTMEAPLFLACLSTIIKLLCLPRTSYPHLVYLMKCHFPFVTQIRYHLLCCTLYTSVMLFPKFQHLVVFVYVHFSIIITNHLNYC